MKCLFCILTIGLMLRMCFAATLPQKHSRVTQRPRSTNQMLLSLNKNGQEVSHKSELPSNNQAAKLKEFISQAARMQGFTSQEARKKRFTSPNLASIFHGNTVKCFIPNQMQ